MPIIVAGQLTIKSKCRDAFIEQSRDAIMLARKDEACDDFSVSSDPIDVNRVNVFEKWKTRQALDAFRASGPANDTFSLVESFDVNEYEVNT